MNKYFWIKCLEYERDTTPTLKWYSENSTGFSSIKILPIPYKTIFIQLARPLIRPQSSLKPQDYPFEAEPCLNEEDDKRGYFGRIWRTQIWQLTASLYPLHTHTHTNTHMHTHLVEDYISYKEDHIHTQWCSHQGSPEGHIVPDSLWWSACSSQTMWRPDCHHAVDSAHITDSPDLCNTRGKK